MLLAVNELIHPILWEKAVHQTGETEADLKNFKAGYRSVSKSGSELHIESKYPASHGAPLSAPSGVWPLQVWATQSAGKYAVRNAIPSKTQKSCWWNRTMVDTGSAASSQKQPPRKFKVNQTAIRCHVNNKGEEDELAEIINNGRRKIATDCNVHSSPVCVIRDRRSSPRFLRKSTCHIFCRLSFFVLILRNRNL